MSEATGTIVDRPERPEEVSRQRSDLAGSLPPVGVLEPTAPARSPWSIAQAITSMVVGRLSTKGALAVVDKAIVSGTSFATSIFIGRLCSRGFARLNYG